MPYIEEGRGGLQGIVGVPTSIALFAGWSARGTTDAAVRVRSFADFEREFGGPDPRSLLGYSVRHFFENGGRDAWVVRIASTVRGRASATVRTPADRYFRSALLARFGQGSITDRIDIYNLLCVPGLVHVPTLAALQAECRRRRAFLVVDAAADATVERMASSATTGLAGADAASSAIYFPWVRATDPAQGGMERDFPPCGFVAGVMARTDYDRGVWKAPAGSDARLLGATGLSLRSADDENGKLNRIGVNVLRTLPLQGNVVWGARTLHGQDERASDWKYIPVRRLGLFIEDSVCRGIRQAVFEPNDEPLWSRLRLTIGEFMQALFRQGAFAGSSPREAWFVKCDRTTMTQADIDGGLACIQVGFAPLKPAEFIVLEIRQKTCDSPS